MTASLVPSGDEVMLRDSARAFLAEASPVSALRANRDGGNSRNRGMSWYRHR